MFDRFGGNFSGQIVRHRARKLPLWLWVLACAACLVLFVVFTEPRNPVGVFAQTQKLQAESNSEIAASDQNSVQQAPAFQAEWAVNCSTVDAELACVASQSFYVRETGQLFMTISVAPPRSNSVTTLIFQLPLGIYLPSGVSMQFGDSPPKTIPILTCEQNGCIAEHAVTDDEITSMLNEENLVVAIHTRDQKSLSVEVPFAGFNQAFAKLR